MTVFPKRVWTKKWMVFNDKRPVRKLGDKVGVYDPNFTEVNSWKVYPEKDRENVSSSDELMYYDWLQPTEFGTFEDGFEATYTFKDYDGTVLKTGKVKDWETPVVPEDPTREGYTFTWWEPKVKAIYKDTTYTAQYEEAPAQTVTVTFAVDPEGSWEIYEGDWETEATTATFPVGTEVKVVVWQDTSIQFDTPDEDFEEFFPISIGSNTFAWVFIGETEVTDQAIELTQDTTLTVKFNEDSR